MPRPVDTPPSPSDSSLCDRIQQFHQRMRSRCLEAHRASTTASDGSAIPCLLQSWRKRIEAMDDPDAQHRKRSHCQFRKASNSSTDESDESTASPPPCRFPFRGPRMHPKLERQQAVCSLSGIWSGFTSSSPPPSPEIYAKPRHRRHPYTRCGRDRDDHGESSTA
ncbi:hypothetical protein DVH05_021673 [Phytophthora capsici]|nr:hypothetical protein DVH05_021673 [Phytophthora capsici]|eukprot:jgi/Phyca11/11332/fgenesh1_pm.PHYCAscaffold_66_\